MIKSAYSMIVILISGLLAACASDSGSQQRAAAPSAQEITADMSMEQTTGPYGRSCRPRPNSMQGTCAAGLLCLPLPGGYCTSYCGDGAGCGPGAVCVESVSSGEGCMAICDSDADCRADEGYVCDPVWKACTFPGAMTLAPKAPVCEPGEALARGRFGPAVQLSTPAGGSGSDQEVHAALDGAGNLTAAHIARTHVTMPAQIGLATIDTGGAVDGDRRLMDTLQSHFDPWMARDRHGKLYLTWMGFEGGEENMQISLATSVDGKTWTQAAAVHDPADCPENAPGCLDKPQMAIGPDAQQPTRDAVYLVYWGNDGQKLRRSTDGGATFSPSVKVSDHVYGDIEVDAAGGVHIVNSTVSPRSGSAFGDPEGAIEYVYSADGERFAAPVPVSAAGEPVPGMFVNPQVVPDSERKTIYVVYPSGSADTRWDIHLAVSTDFGESWSHRRVNDDAPCANHMLPAATLDPQTGRVHIIWVENRGGTGQVAYASCDATGCTANERVSEAPFAAYSFSRHTSKWLGEYNALVFDAERRVLHAVWGQPVDEDGVPRARIFHAKAALP